MAINNNVIRRFYQALGVLLVLLGIVSLLVPVLPGVLFIILGVGVISPAYRERMLEAGRRIVERLPVVRRFRRRQAIRLVLIMIAAVLVGIVLAAAFLRRS